MEIAEHIAKQILKLKPENASGYMLLSNIYAAIKHLCCCWQQASQ
jgi:hypothetical protein